MANCKNGTGMDYAKTLLSKYGWKEGQGLGRNETGITQALKPRLKFDTAGIGHDAADTFTNHWWEKAFNTAADNISVTKTKDGNVSMTTTEEFDISANRVSAKKRKRMLYNNFVKTATLTKEGSMVEEEKDPLIEEAIGESTQSLAAATILSDEQLFKICGGRTAHKGARHGLGLSGKLARIEEQERQMLEKLADHSSRGISECNKQTKKKKKSKSRSHEVEEPTEVVSAELLVSDNDGPKKSKKRRKSSVETEDLASCIAGDDSEVRAAIIEDKHVKKRKKSKGKQVSSECE